MTCGHGVDAAGNAAGRSAVPGGEDAAAAAELHDGRRGGLGGGADRIEIYSYLFELRYSL